jgi:xylulokinase
MSIIGLDIGTTGCKAIVFNQAGEILGQAAREYAVLTPRPDWAEQDAEAVWELAWAALGEAVAAVEDDPPVALAISCQGEAVIPVDGAGRALRPAILGMDTRTGAENEWLAGKFGAEELFSRTGMPVSTVNTLPKLLWLQRHEPDIWQSAAQFLLYEDFFLRRLGGRAVISHCLASRTQMYDLTSGDWADDILDKCDIERARLAPLAPAEGGVAGALRSELATELGLGQALKLVSGGHDQACAALGSGVVQPGLAMVSTGTAEVVEVAMASPALDKSLRQSHISVYRHVAPGLFLTMTLNHSGGLLLRWFRDTLARWEREQAGTTGRDAYDLILADAPPGPTDLMVLPHFGGTSGDEAVKGAILGLTFGTTGAIMAKAILEGLTFDLRANLDLLQNAGITISELHAVGGGARSPLWLRLKADICRTSLRVPRVTEAACLGAALLAGAAAGLYPNLSEAVNQTVQFRQRIEPDPAQAATYEGRYQLYRQVDPVVSRLHQQF